MSGQNAFLSFANWLKTELTGSGITVDIEKRTTKTPPYLLLEDGPEQVTRRWLSSRMCQGKLVVAANTTEPLQVTAGNLLEKVLRATRDAGSVEKFDYTQTPKKSVGVFNLRVFEVTGDISQDPLVCVRVITWEVDSNAA